MAFGHDQQGKARFGLGPQKQTKHMPTKEKGPSEHRPGAKEVPHAPHGDTGEKHVTETHPGQTQPHPHTGVHAFHAHHVGGGRYKSHTHHEDKTVESKDHPDHNDMSMAMNESLPPSEDMGEGNDLRHGGEEFSNELGGIGGEGEESV